MGCVPQKREALFQSRPKLQTPKRQNMFLQCPHHHAIQTSTDAGWALNFTSITSKQIDQWVQMSLPHPPRHTHITGGANKATCMTQQYSKIKHIGAKPGVPKLQSIFGSSLIKNVILTYFIILTHYFIIYHLSDVIFFNSIH